MKEINISIGQLFDFIKDKYGKDFNYDSFIDTPIKLQVKNENNKWVNVSKLVRKQDALYETTFSNGITLKSAAKHIVSFFPDMDLHKYTEDIVVGDKLNYLNIEVTSNKKISSIEDVFGIQVDTDTHLYKDSNGIIHHNTTTVNRAIQDGQALWTPNRRHSTLPTVVKESGSIGSSFTPLLLFFYKNRHNKLILLDDCDGFVVSTNKDIQNFLKALVGPQLPISVSPTILDNANNSLKKEFSDKKKESIIEVNTDRLAEGICNVTANGENFDFSVSFEEAVELGKAFGYNKLSETNKPRKLINRFGEYGNIQAIREVQALNQRAADLENAISKGFERSDMQEDIPMSDGDAVEYVIQNKWEFDSSIIFVTNLALSEVDQAVLSRCEKSELRLTMLEYLCRAEQILGDMKIGIESSNAAEVIEWCKYEAFALFKILLLGTTKYKNWAVNIKAHLDFRLLNVITNKFLIRVNKLWAKEGIDPTIPTNRPIIEDKVRGKFIEDLIKVLATG